MHEAEVAQLAVIRRRGCGPAPLSSARPPPPLSLGSWSPQAAPSCHTALVLCCALLAPPQRVWSMPPLEKAAAAAPAASATRGRAREWQRGAAASCEGPVPSHQPAPLTWKPLLRQPCLHCASMTCPRLAAPHQPPAAWCAPASQSATHLCHCSTPAGLPRCSAAARVWQEVGPFSGKVGAPGGRDPHTTASHPTHPQTGNTSSSTSHHCSLAQIIVHGRLNHQYAAGG